MLGEIQEQVGDSGAMLGGELELDISPQFRARGVQVGGSIPCKRLKQRQIEFADFCDSTTACSARPPGRDENPGA